MLNFCAIYPNKPRLKVLYVFQLELLWNLLLSRIQIQTFNAYE